MEGHYLQRWARYVSSLGARAPGILPTQLQGIRIGVGANEWHLVTSSHEVVAGFASPIRSIWPYPRLTLMGYANGQISYLPNSKVLADPPCLRFPVDCGGNYEGGDAFTWYGHRAPVTSEVDTLFVNGNIQLLDHGRRQIGSAADVIALAAWNNKNYCNHLNQPIIVGASD